MRVFPDAVVVIYLIEQHATFGPRAEAALNAHPGDLVSSELVRSETLVRPVRNADHALIAEFEDYFRLQVTEMVPLDRPVFDRVTAIRAQHGFKTPDATNLAAAVQAGCDVFLTNEPNLAKYTGIRVVLI
ncbi:MAG: PIN domain-containing protein [Gemmataceae bacterium]|nr:PIN domain-containing protein [Gemmataceae bacterium]